MQLFTGSPCLFAIASLSKDPSCTFEGNNLQLLIYQLKVHQKQNTGLSWNRAIDEVSVERLVQKYKESGELDSEDPALLMLKKWPVSKQCKDNAEKLPGLEHQVSRYAVCM